MQTDAATFGWLCVETSIWSCSRDEFFGSHLRVAVCWNPDFAARVGKLKAQPPSGGCVLKPYQYRAHGNRFTPATFGGYTLKQILINLNSIIFTFLLYLSTRFIPNNIPPCISHPFALDYAPFLAFMIYNYACFWLSFWLTGWADRSLP